MPEDQPIHYEWWISIFINDIRSKVKNMNQEFYSFTRNSFTLRNDFLGCDEIRSPDDGFFTYEVNGALVRFFCSDDRILVGDSVLGCDGQFWNGTTPTCVIPTTTTTSTTPRPKSFSANDLTSSGASWTSFEAGFIAVCLTVVAVSSSRNLAQ